MKHRAPPKQSLQADTPSQPDDIGPHVRFLRRRAALTLDELAGRAGLTKSFVSKIERGLSVPSISTTMKLATGLDVTIGQLLGETQDDDAICVVRKQDRRPFLRRGSSTGYNYEAIAARKKFKSMEPFVMRPPRVFEDDRRFQHVGQEMIFVLRGTIEVEFPGKRIQLEEGDAIYFDAHVPHRTRSIGRKQAEALVVVAETPA